MPLVVARSRSIKAIEKARDTDGLLLIVAQRPTQPTSSSDPLPSDLHEIGTLCKIENVTVADSGSRQIIVTGIGRVRASEYQLDEAASHLTARVQWLPDAPGTDAIRVQALFSSLKELAREVLDLLPGTTEPLTQLIERIGDPAYLTHLCAAYLSLTVPQKQALLETPAIDARMELLLDHMRKERDVLSLRREMRDKLSERLTQAQREALLREQLRTIRSELGDDPNETAEETADALEDKLRRTGLPVEAMRQVQEEVKRLKSVPPASAESHVIRTYLETIAAMPWATRTGSTIELARARAALDEDHYGLDRVKKRIVQYLAVAKLRAAQAPDPAAVGRGEGARSAQAETMRGPILCLVGPPGVGKTSLGQSIARALGRKFARASLGGVRDEAEIRGHRRTYVGAMPGRILQSIKRAGTRNPVLLLDEIDKLRSDVNGDPSAAMLEVLDPEQNHAFVDHYLDIPFDLSEVFFVATANVADAIPPALRDRMEMIEVHGYTSREKLEIARRHLIPRLLAEHGLVAYGLTIDDPTVERIIRNYTRESGVRELQRHLAAVMRATAEEIVNEQEARAPGQPERKAGPSATVAAAIGPERLDKILGPERYYPDVVEGMMKPGVALGLAWTPVGGEMMFLEATAIPSASPHLTLTGSLGDVMKESAQIALSLARKITPAAVDLAKHDIHVHVPAGAIPKDGPSAGATILAALASLITGRSIAPNLAMTGEITLRGAVLPVGGLKEKVIAAHRAGVRSILLPRRNRQDMVDIPAEVTGDLRFIYVDTIDDVLEHSIGRPPGAGAAVPEAVPRELRASPPASAA